MLEIAVKADAAGIEHRADCPVAGYNPGAQQFGNRDRGFHIAGFRFIVYKYIFMSYPS